MRYELSPKNTVIVRGPALVTALAGHPIILGGPLAPGNRKIVEPQKQLPIETEGDARIEVVLGKSAEIFEVPGSSIPTSWKEAATTLQRMKKGRVVILGQPDVGKSTLCVYLVNKLLQSRQTVHVVDADIGQADLGPPTTIAHAVPTDPIASLQELTPDQRLFIGRISPSGAEQKLISSIRKLSSGCERSLTIINTDGWIADVEAILYKIDLLAQVNANLVVGLAYSNELQPILEGACVESFRIDAAKEVLERSRVDRRRIRTEGYRRFLAGAVTRRVSLEEVHLILPPHCPRIVRPNRRSLNNVILGVLNEMGYLTEIGILTKIERDWLRIYSRHTGRFSRVEIGYVKLSMSGREIGSL